MMYCPRCEHVKRDLETAQGDIDRAVKRHNELVGAINLLRTRLEILVSADVLDAVTLWSESVSGADKKRADLLLSQLTRARQ